MDTNNARRIHTLVTKSAFLHIEDYLHLLDKNGNPAPKLRFFGAKYNSDGMGDYVSHFVDVDTLRPFLADLTHAHLVDVQWIDRKGSQTKNKTWLANILAINARDVKNERKWFIDFSLVPGERVGPGIVKAQEGRQPISSVTLMVSAAALREMAYKLQSYLQAYETCRLWQHMMHTGEAFPAYPVGQQGMTPAADDVDDVMDGADDDNEPLPADAPQNGQAQSAYKYGDGSFLPDTPGSVRVYKWFVQVHNHAPQNRKALSSWWEKNKANYTL